ncbi:MAG: T9SS type A sorting domain-containing protein [Bacteroidota bacterium]
MKRIFTRVFLFLITISISASMTAQGWVDQVSVGAAYSQQAYYTFESADEDGTVETVANEAWDIAFSTGAQDAGVFINEATTFMSSPLQVFLAPTNEWSDPINNTDEFVDEVALHNPDLVWTEGAFNSMKDPSSPFDFGWGAYNPMTNTVNGSIVFVIKLRDGSFMKFQVMALEGSEYSIRYANLDGSNEVSTAISKEDSEGALVYYSFNTEGTVDVPTSYDLVFQRYSTPLPAGPDVILEYYVTGVLLGPGVQAVRVEEVDPTMVMESDYSDQYSTDLITIGHSWKAFDFAVGWLILEDRTHFVKLANGDVYQVTFFDFQGSSTGNSTFQKTFITTVSTDEEFALDANIKVYPNPAADFISIENASQKDMQIQFRTLTGQLVKKVNAKNNDRISIDDLNTGMYNVVIEAEGQLKIQKLVVR